MTVTRSGHIIKPTGRYDPETGKTIKWNMASVTNYYKTLQDIMDKDELEEAMEVHTAYSEVANVGAGLGGGFKNTEELHPMKLEEAMSGPDADAWAKEIEKEHSRMVENKVWEVVPRSEVPKGTRAIDSTWACKKKSNGMLRGRLNTRGFKQVEGVHYDGSSIHLPVTNMQ